MGNQDNVVEPIEHCLGQKMAHISGKSPLEDAHWRRLFVGFAWILVLQVPLTASIHGRNRDVPPPLSLFHVTLVFVQNSGSGMLLQGLLRKSNKPSITFRIKGRSFYFDIYMCV